MIPKSKRQRKSKSKLTKCDPYPIEDFSLRFPNLTEAIFDQIDNKNLKKCRTVSKSWCSIIDGHRNTWMRMIRTKYCKRDLSIFKENWGKLVHGTPREMLKELALTVMKVSTISGFGGTSMGIHGFQPIHFAAINGNLKLYIFISEKVEEKLPNDNVMGRNDTPLDFACKYGHLEVVKYIIQCVDTKCVEDRKWPFDFAARGGHLEIYKCLEDHFRGQTFIEDMKRVALNAAAEHGQLDVFKYIIDSFKDINPPQINGITPLHLAAEKGHLNICMFILSSNLSNKNPKSKNGETPLHRAARFGRLEVFKYIAGYCNNKNPKKKDGTTPLLMAAKNGHVEICKHILSHIKDKNPIIKNGETLLHIVAKLPKTWNVNHLEVYKCIAENVEDKNPFDKNLKTPLSLTKNPDIYNYIAQWKNSMIRNKQNEMIQTILEMNE